MLNNKRNSSLKINKSIYFLAFLVILSLILPSAFSEAFSSVPTTEKIDKSADVPNAGIKAAVNSGNTGTVNTNSVVVTSYVEDGKGNSVVKTPAQSVAAPVLYDSKINNIEIPLSGNSSANFPAESVGHPINVSGSITNLSAIPPPPAPSNPIAVDTIIPNFVNVAEMDTKKHFSAPPSEPVQFTERTQPNIGASSEKISYSPKVATPSKIETSSTNDNPSGDEMSSSESKGIWFRIKSWLGLNGE